ncbi:MAG: hypothetical protein AAGD25_25080 [Cyanobacteria bacterium P01_F01_bin.150]
MVPDGLHYWITTPVYKRRDLRLFVWFGLSVTFALIYSFIGLQDAFSSAYVIHDDVRSHVFWMYRFVDPGLFPNDLIADYFQSVAPYGYTALYRGAVLLGFDPVVFNKLLPLVLVLMTTGFCYWLTLTLFPLPAAGFIATLLLNQTIWNTHDIPSGTPRAFIYPLFLAFLYYLVRQSLLPCLASILLQGLFYPQCLFLSAGILVLRLFRLEKWRLRLSGDRRDWLFCVTGLSIAFVMLLPYALKISDYGPVLTAAEGRQLPILQNDGRKYFFFDDPLQFWFCGERSGLLPYNWCKTGLPPQLWASLLFLGWIGRSPRRFPLVRQLSTQASVLPHILLSSLGMFFLAHLLLFRLHLPSRYTKHSLRMLVAIVGAIAFVSLFDAVLCWINRRSEPFNGIDGINGGASSTPYAETAQSRSNRLTERSVLSLGAVGVMGVLILGYPFLMDEYPNPDYVTAEAQEIYGFLAEQPQDTVIASLSEQANNIPSLSQRSILTSSEIANPYHYGYYQAIQARTEDLMQAQYSPRAADLRNVTQKYGIDFWLVDGNAFNSDYILSNSWLREIEPLATTIIQRLNQGKEPVMAKRMKRCSVLKTEGRFIVDATCVLNAKGPLPRR